MKEVKAYIHRNRAADVVRALRKAGFGQVTLVDVKQVLKTQDASDQEYSTEFGARIITEVKLELVCETARLEEAIALIRENAKTGQTESGFICVSEISTRYRL